MKFTKAERKNIFILPVEQRVYVPSTIHDKRISKAQQRKRIREVKRFLSNNFGGFTSVSAHGGFYSNQKNKIIQEPVTVVTSFATRKAYRNNIADLKKQLRIWKRKWHQESMGYEHEGDLFYFS